MDKLQESTKREEYLVWRKNVPFLYDMMFSVALKWPTPSVQWFPSAERLDNRSTVQRLMLTTFSNGAAGEELLFANVIFPDLIDEDAINHADIELNFSQSIPLPLDINKARYSPLATNIIACITEQDEVLIYDYTKHSSIGSLNGPEASFAGHLGGGFALSWNQTKWSEFVTGGRDKTIKIFDVNKGVTNTILAHNQIVNDISHSYFNSHVFASVSDDLSLVLHDTRKDLIRAENIIRIEKCHFSTVESCAFSPLKAELLATGSSSGEIKVWDTRNTSEPIFLLRGHTNAVNVIKWSPHSESIIASASKNGRVMIWDLNKTDLVFDDATESPELCFVHGGHMSSVDDIDWNPAEPFEIVSVSNDGLLHIWKVSLDTL